MSYRIVVGVDGSPRSNAALRWSLAAAEVHGGEVVAVYAWQIPFVSVPGAFDRDELEQAAKQFIIDTVSKIVPTPAIPLWRLVAEGDPAASLAEASKQASVLVLGTRGRSRWAGRLLGFGEPAMRSRGRLPRHLGQAVRRGDRTRTCQGPGRQDGTQLPNWCAGHVVTAFALTALVAVPARLAVADVPYMAMGRHSTGREHARGVARITSGASAG